MKVGKSELKKDWSDKDMATERELQKFVEGTVYACMTSIVDELLNCSDDFQNAYYDELERQCASSNWLEVWSVSDYLAKELEDEDEFVFEYNGHNLWFRETSGQAISMDSVIEDIYDNICQRVGIGE